MKNPLKKIYFFLLSFLGTIKFKFYILTHSNIKVIVGAGKTKIKGWFSTEEYFFNIVNPLDYEKFFKKKKIDFLLAEHVLEHIDQELLNITISNFFKYSNQNCNIRIAVPDGFHPDINYINYVKPGGGGAGAKEHKSLFNYKTLMSLFSEKGFVPDLIEYWDDKAKFHSKYKNDEKGIVYRSFINDERNIDNKLSYTSLIIDFRKNFKL